MLRCTQRLGSEVTTLAKKYLSREKLMSALQNVLLFAHSDGDGHIAAEQSRRNLAQLNYDVIDVVVDSSLTRNSSFWEKGFAKYNFGHADIVTIVDIMFNRKDPGRSIEAFFTRAESEPDRRFLLIDHHTFDLPNKRPKNIEIRFVDKVYECCYGPPSDLMLIASVCDNDEKPVKERITDVHRKRARGVKRAVSDKFGLAGRPTLQLIKDGAWDVFESLADEPREYHRTFYGNRIESRAPTSPILKVAHAVRGI